MKKNISDMRKSYEKASLNKKSVEQDPVLQFSQWFEVACESNQQEANVMHLSTVTGEGQPEGRIVLLKSFDEAGFVFFTHYTSDKGRSIQANNKVALTFYWPELERQVRIEGLATAISAADSDEYFYSRPEDSQVGAMASPQSQVIENYAVLESAMATLTAQGEITRPAEWGGYCVVPSSIEFWQGRPSRLHDRIKYIKSGKTWKIDRLAP